MSEAITRKSYQSKRYKFLNSILDVDRSIGLEIGACDLPTVPRNLGSCDFADLRSKEEMVQMWNLPVEDVMDIDFLLTRDRPINQQIEKRFDYVVACHVIEHIANPIGYINDLQRLLDPNGARIVVLSAPDKRFTLDSTRTSVTLDHLLMDYYEDAKEPSLEHILAFARAWSPELAAVENRSLVEFFRWAKDNSVNFDAHCHVWTDEEFFGQMAVLSGNGFFAKTEILATQPTPPGFNEFTIALRSIPGGV